MENKVEISEEDCCDLAAHILNMSNTTTEIFDNSVRIEVNRRFEEIQKVIENGGE